MFVYVWNFLYQKELKQKKVATHESWRPAAASHCMEEAGNAGGTTRGAGPCSQRERDWRRGGQVGLWNPLGMPVQGREPSLSEPEATSEQEAGSEGLQAVPQGWGVSWRLGRGVEMP